MDVDKNTSEVKKNGMMVWACEENAMKQTVAGNPRMGTPERTRRDDLKREGRMESDGV